MDLFSLKTPCLLVDIARVRRNAERISALVRRFGVSLRPHVKTHKCVEIARIQTAGHSGGITVSTLAEAQSFRARGFTDITYAVPIEAGKFAAAIELARSCERFAVIIDDLELPAQLNSAARQAGVTFDVFLKVDCGYHRCGVAPQSPAARAIPERISDASNLRFAGILTHAGHSYNASTQAELLAIARQERDILVDLAAELRSAGIKVPVVSVGSTPTITHVDHLEGVDEARPGNYIFFDAFQAELGSCRLEDCALTVLTAVVHSSKERIVVDAGAIALSKDRGMVSRDQANHYGLVLDLAGNDLGLRVDALSQEHGEIFLTGNSKASGLKCGTRVRILANHSCLTAAQHSHYYVLEGDRIVDRWEIQRGW